MNEPPTCHACGAATIDLFHEVRNVPVNSVLSLDNRDDAVRFPRGHIQLGFCRGCGFIQNVAFEPKRLEYSERYEPTQAFSPTFNRWHRHLAHELIARHGLHGKSIVEIGCGKGEFLALLCEIGGNRGVGFDPAFSPGRLREEEPTCVEFIADFYSDRYAGRQADFVCCKMTLEHIRDVMAFLTMVRRSLGEAATKTTVFFQVPDGRRILEECAFWDIYYEHCSYFSTGSLSRLFRRCGFAVSAVDRSYGGQYITLEALADEGQGLPPPEAEDDLDDLQRLVERFQAAYPHRRDEWRARVRARAAAGQRLAIWGSGSKGVAFLTTLGLHDDVRCVVDINPHRRGKHMLGTGHPVIAPEDLRAHRPHVVIAMNPLYRSEITAELERLGMRPEVWTL
jgi:ubiquinone/menaquinone biosynthesis C-methylase UbiE